MITASILDPIQSTLPAEIWDAPESIMPKLKERHQTWLEFTISEVFARHGYEGLDRWGDLYLSGSLTTYQYSDASDCDISLFVKTDVLPEWSRAEMIGICIEFLDGQILPGTTHPLQTYAVARGITPEKLYQPGLRSGYQISTGLWVVPPEKARAHNPEQELNGFYTYALQEADKLESLLKYEKPKAIQLWHQIHRRRMRDMQAGKGDYSSANLVWKMLSNHGLDKQLAELTGEHIV